MSHFVSGSIPTRSPRTTFKAEVAEAKNDLRIGDPVITKRLQSRGIHVYATPTSMVDGFIRRLGRIFYSAAINKNDSEAMTALAEERARRETEAKAKATKRHH